MNISSLTALGPWLITEAGYEAFAAALQQLIAAKPAPVNGNVSSSLLAVENGIATIPITGPMLRDAPDWLLGYLGATSMEKIGAAINQAVGREDVRGIILNINSPGGTVNGTPELADTVAEATRTKPVYSFTAGMMASAAYWVGSQANAIYATRSSSVGSIGTLMTRIDISRALEQAGIKVEVFASGKYKGAGVPGTSLTEDQRDLYKDLIAKITDDFKAAILSTGRRIPDEAMQGQVFMGTDIYKNNLALPAPRMEQAVRGLNLLSGISVDKRKRENSNSSVAITTMDIEAQLKEANDKNAKLEADAKANADLLTEANKKATDAEAKAAKAEAELKVKADELERVKTQNADLTKANADLAAKEQDIAKRVAAEAAAIAARSGSGEPVTGKPEGEQTPKSAAERWNQQFATT